MICEAVFEEGAWVPVIWLLGQREGCCSAGYQFTHASPLCYEADVTTGQKHPRHPPPAPARFSEIID